jgi:hypothetical protein
MMEPADPEGSVAVALSHPMEMPPGLLSQIALQLMQSEGGKDLEGLFAQAYQLICKEKEFLSEVPPAELAFVAIHGRRWKLGEGVVLPDTLIFDPAKPAESCKIFRSKLKGTPLAHRNAILERWIRECHEIYFQQREKHGQGERVPGFEGFIFVGGEIEGLKRYLRIRSVKSRSAKRARQLFLAGHEKSF